MSAVRMVVLALLVGLSACQRATATPASGGFNTMALRGPESWVIDGASRTIDATYYLALPEGLQFTIEVPVESAPGNDSVAREQAWPYIRYVYENGIHLRTKVKRNGTPVQATRIGVALVVHAGIRHSGYRIGMTIADIEARRNR